MRQTIPSPMSIAVLGVGTMGASIARILAGRGHRVTVHDPDPHAADKVLADPGTISAAGTLEDAVADATIVFEAIPEELSLKRATIARIQEVSAEIIIASNTSTYSPTELSSGATSPETILVAHFFNPADVVALVELVGSPATDPAALSLVETLLVDAGKRPVTLRKERVGFAANRLQAAMYREALALLDDGVLSAEDLDTVVTHGLGPRWAWAGPFTIMDLGGLDIWRTVLARIQPDLDASTTPSPTLAALADAGNLGAKTGSGFYNRDSAADDGLRARIAEQFRSI